MYIHWNITQPEKEELMCCHMNLGDFMLNKILQSQEDKCCTIPLVWGTHSGQTHRESRMMVAMGLERGRNGCYCLMDYGVSVWEDEKSSGNGWWWQCPTVRIYLMPLNCRLENGQNDKVYIRYISPQFSKAFSLKKNQGGSIREEPVKGILEIIWGNTIPSKRIRSRCAGME